MTKPKHHTSKFLQNLHWLTPIQKHFLSIKLKAFIKKTHLRHTYGVNDGLFKLFLHVSFLPLRTLVVHRCFQVSQKCIKHIQDRGSCDKQTNKEFRLLFKQHWGINLIFQLTGTRKDSRKQTSDIIYQNALHSLINNMEMLQWVFTDD